MTNKFMLEKFRNDSVRAVDYHGVTMAKLTLGTASTIKTSLAVYQDAMTARKDWPFILKKELGL